MTVQLLQMAPAISYICSKLYIPTVTVLLKIIFVNFFMYIKSIVIISIFVFNGALYKFLKCYIFSFVLEF